MQPTKINQKFTGVKKNRVLTVANFIGEKGKCFDTLVDAQNSLKDSTVILVENIEFNGYTPIRKCNCLQRAWL